MCKYCKKLELALIYIYLYAKNIFQMLCWLSLLYRVDHIRVVNHRDTHFK